MDHKLILAGNQHLFPAAGGRKITNSLPIDIIKGKKSKLWHWDYYDIVLKDSLYWYKQ